MSFDLQPNLKGELIELRRLTPGDWKELFAVASDPLIWEQHPECDRYKEDVFKTFFKEALESGGAFVIIDKKTQQIIGSTRFYGYAPEKSEIEIGWTAQFWIFGKAPSLSSDACRIRPGREVRSASCRTRQAGSLFSADHLNLCSLVCIRG